MTTRDSPRFALTRPQVIAVLVLLLAALYLASFAAKSYELYQLRAWESSLREEIAVLERQEKAMELEIRRRQSIAWVDAALRKTGRVPRGVVVVSLVGKESPVVEAPPPVTPPVTQEQPVAPTRETWFANPNWDAWQQLILQRR